MGNGGVWASSLSGERIPAAEQLDAAVRSLTHAKRRQVFVECGWTGLFWGLLGSCALVLVIRVGELAHSGWSGVALLFALSLAAAGVVAWRRRPDELDVTIFADLEMNLQQKLSTAWEFARSEADPALTERLAAQAVKERIYPRSERVFPLRINVWGKLTPVAATLLVLVSIVDLPRGAEPARLAVDQILVEEGVRLREYGRQLEGRARREELPRSAGAARQMQRLGSRMESAVLSRRQALSRLRQLASSLDEQRRSALSGAIETRIGPVEMKALAASPIVRSSSLLALLRKLMDGGLAPGELELHGDDAAALSQLGITPEQLRAALESLAAGDDRELSEILEMLSQLDQAVREAEELQWAQEAVTRAQENLGETGVFARRPADVEGAQSGEAAGASNPRDRLLGNPGMMGDFAAPSRGYDRDLLAENRGRGPSIGAETARGGVVMKPRSQLRQGQVFTSEARVLPRQGRPGAEQMALDPRFAAQMEEVLSKEQYPLHDKEFIRKYFLTLSEGIAADPSRAGEPAQ